MIRCLSFIFAFFGVCAAKCRVLETKIAVIPVNFAGLCFFNQKPNSHQIGQRSGKVISLLEMADPPQFCTPLGLKRQKRTRCYDIIRTRCTLLLWVDLPQQLSLIGGCRNRLLRFNKVVYSREESEYSEFRHLSSMENSRDQQDRALDCI